MKASVYRRRARRFGRAIRTYFRRRDIAAFGGMMRALELWDEAWRAMPHGRREVERSRLRKKVYPDG